MSRYNDFRHGGRFPLHGPIPLDAMRSASCVLDMVLKSISTEIYVRTTPDFSNIRFFELHFSNMRFFGLHQVMEQSRWFK